MGGKWVQSVTTDNQIRGLYVLLGAMLHGLLVLFVALLAQVKRPTEEVVLLRTETRATRVINQGPPPIRRLKDEPYIDQDLERWWALAEGRESPTAKGKGKSGD